MGRRMLLQEPLLWLTLLLTFLAIGTSLYIDFASGTSGGAPTPPGIIKNSLLPIFAPVLTEMIAFFFVADTQVRAASRRTTSGPRTRVALVTASLYGILPTLIMLLGHKATLRDDLSTFQLVAQPIFAYVIVYYFGRKPEGFARGARADENAGAIVPR